MHNKKISAAVLTTGIIIMLLYLYKDRVLHYLGAIKEIGAIFFFSFILAFFLYRPYQFSVSIVRKCFKRCKCPEKTALVLLYGMLTLLILLFFSFIVPKLIDSILLLYSNADSITKSIESVIGFFQQEFSAGSVLHPLRNILTPNKEAFEVYTGKGMLTIRNLGKYSVNLVFSFLLSGYLLLEKRVLFFHLKKFLKLHFGKNISDRYASFIRLTLDAFSRFSTGQALDALLLGILCFLGMYLFDFPYPFLISFIIGMSSLIPILGPVAGSAVSALILSIFSLKKSIIFIVFILVLQQIDANFIYPNIVGKNLGIPSLWVVISILIGASLFGSMGVVLAVPFGCVAHTLYRQIGR